ncbi:MAG TPA: hypothetical protein VF347_05005 [Candidatus Humimicrobiaceae bacterium]
MFAFFKSMTDFLNFSFPVAAEKDSRRKPDMIGFLNVYTSSCP